MQDIDSQLQITHTEEYEWLKKHTEEYGLIKSDESKFSVVESILLSDCVLYDWWYLLAISKSLEKDETFLTKFKSSFPYDLKSFVVDNSQKLNDNAQQLTQVIEYFNVLF